MGLQLLQSKSVLKRVAPVSVDVANGRQRSNAAWPA
jgi:hypothetical protein